MNSNLNLNTSSPLSFRVSQRTLNVLEWPEIQSFFWDHAQTVYGRKCAENSLPGVKPHVSENKRKYFDSESSETYAQAVLEARQLRLSQAQRLPVMDTPDLGNTLVRVSRQAAISLTEFADLVRFHKSAQGLKSYVLRLGQEYRVLPKLLGTLVSADDWAKKHFSLLDHQGLLVDHASEDLRALRHLASELHQQIKTKLEDYLHNPKLAEIMQDFYVTVRDGRYVIPVKTNFRGKVPGIVHDVSNTEATLFVEPQEIVEWNNQLKVTEVEIEKEIEKILAQVVQDTKPFVGAFEKNAEIIGLADYFNSVAEWVERLQDHVCVAQESSQEPIEFRELYHPLLALKNRVVSNSFQIKGAFVLSGPNTGGKTVLLKSLGLAILMSRSGLPVPASTAQIPRNLTGVMADIGDDQNIAENLSTFSAHLRALHSMLTQSEAGDLILIDEIATGTSPEEGQPLAQAIIESFLDRNLRVFVTTHYGALKQFAMMDPRARVASMSFDRQTRKPTYEIQLDLPGESSALDIAEQVGFPVDILNRARKLKGDESPDLGLALQKLEEARIQLTQKESELQKQVEAAQLREKTALDKAREWDLKMREGLSQEAREILKNLQTLREDLNLKVRSVQSTDLGSGAKDLLDKIKDASDLTRSYTQNSRPIVPDELLTLEELHAGLIVEVEGFGMGRINEAPRDFSKGHRTPVAVKVGDLLVNVVFSKLRKASADKEKQHQAQTASREAHRDRKFLASGVSSATPQNSAPSALVCDVRGKTFDEALRKVEVSLNEIAKNEDLRVTLIHGHGSEKLKEGIRNYLRKERSDLSFRTGSWPGEGGDGVTVVERAKS